MAKKKSEEKKVPSNASHKTIQNGNTSSDDFENYIKRESEKINRYIMKLFDDTIKSEDEVFLRNFFSLGKDFILRGGKRLLAICALNTFMGLSSDKDIIEHLDDVYLTSISLELLHMSEIIVDDLMDKDELRAGLPTFHKYIVQAFPQLQENDPNATEAGESATVYGSFLTSFLGSEVIAKSNFDSARKSQATLYYYDGLSGINRGYLLDDYYRLIPMEQITLENYLLLAGLKRGKQMETAVAIGAALANARSTQIRPLMQAMNKVGVIDQLINDYDGTFGDPTKKSTENDIKQGQRTILTIIAYQSANDDQKARMNEILGNMNATHEDIEEVKQIFIDTGAADFVKFYANSLKNDAYALLQNVYPGLRKETQQYFEDLMTYIISSTF
jgi:geranylgeranyl diphosphate synthase type I